MLLCTFEDQLFERISFRSERGNGAKIKFILRASRAERKERVARSQNKNQNAFCLFHSLPATPMTKPLEV
jgi:hypothetical protein